MSQTPLSLIEAMTLFTAIAERRDIAFNWAREGCHARAQMMRRALEDAGHAPQLAWAVEGREPLTYLSPGGEMICWRYHVAVAVPITRESGVAEICVFDPSMYDAPVPFAMWQEEMGAEPKLSGVVEYGAENYEVQSSEGEELIWRMNRLSDDTAEMMMYERLQAIAGDVRTLKRIVGASPLKAEAERALGEALPREGSGWISFMLQEERDAKRRTLPVARATKGPGPI